MLFVSFGRLKQLAPIKYFRIYPTKSPLKSRPINFVRLFALWVFELYQGQTLS